MTDDPKIVSIVDRLNKAEQQSTPVVIDEGPKPWEPAPAQCEHERYRVDAVLPKVTCAECGEVLDPYYALRLVGEYFKKRDYRWDAIKDQEKASAQHSVAELHRVSEWEANRGGPPMGSYQTRNHQYVVQHTPKGWEVAWQSGVIRTTGTLSAAKTFIRDHVRTNWGKEPVRSLAQNEAAGRTLLSEIKLYEEDKIVPAATPTLTET